MTKKLDDLLCKKYPLIFQDRHADMRTTCMCWGMECGDGWFSILDNLCDFIQSRINNTHPAPPQVVADQVKEKWGGLRFYYHGGDDVVRGAIDFAEYLAYRTCENCGETDPKIVGSTRRGWIHTVCRDCKEPATRDMTGWMSLEAMARRAKRKAAAEAKKAAKTKAKK